MDEYESLSHSKWECKYHVIFIPKCRRKTLYKELRQHLANAAVPTCHLRLHAGITTEMSACL